MAQLHKKFNTDDVKELFRKYLDKEIKRKHVCEILGIGKTRFFALLKMYRKSPLKFSIRYKRTFTNNQISQGIENLILKELKKEKELILNKEVPINKYNYSFIKEKLERKYKQKVSLPTIINRAKRYNFYIPKRKNKKEHSREVLTNYIGELIQHDTSYHLFSPPAKERWCLITSIDDYSRFILYAKLLKKETSWAHILAIQTIFLSYGVPLNFYVDSHSIFRFVQSRDSIWRRHYKLTDEATPQWKKVLDDCNVKVIYALSPQAKGKVERPYRWIQDHLVRLCVEEDITNIRSAQKILNQEVYHYNYRRIHSTTKEIPYLRFQRALKEKKSLFREFRIKPPFISPKDIFCLRVERIVDRYKKISLNNIELKINNAPWGAKVEIRIYLNLKTGLAEIRVWYKNKLLDIKKAKLRDLGMVHF